MVGKPRRSFCRGLGRWAFSRISRRPVVLVGILGDGEKQTKSVVWSWRTGPFQRRRGSCAGCAGRIDSHAVIWYLLGHDLYL